MKKKTNAMAVVVFTASILFSCTVLAADMEEIEFMLFGPPSDAQGHPPPPPMHAGHLLEKALMDHATLEVLMELTGKDAETVQATMENLGMREVLSSYGIDEAVFQESMDSKIKALVNKAAGCGLISSQKALEIIESIGSQTE